MGELDRQLRRARAQRDQAMAGKSPGDALVAGIKASLEYGLADLKHNTPRLEAALGEPIDHGSFLLGMTAAGFAIQEIDLVAIMRDYPVVRQLVIDTMRKVRER